MNDLNFTTTNSIFHHGIEGQKWGVQNGPPYPLDRDNAGRIIREKKEKLARAKESKKYTNMSKRVGKFYRPFMTAGITTSAAALTKMALSSEGGLTSKKKQNRDSAIAIGSLFILPVLGPIIGSATASKKDKEEYKEVKNYIKSAKEELRLAQKYVDLATRQNLSDEQLIDLANLKTKINLEGESKKENLANEKKVKENIQNKVPEDKKKIYDYLFKNGYMDLDDPDLFELGLMEAEESGLNINSVNTGDLKEFNAYTKSKI